MMKTTKSESKLYSYEWYRKLKVRIIKEMIKNKIYDWDEAIKITASKIMDCPESLLWR